MAFKIVVTDDAALDMEDIRDYVAAHDSSDRAEYVFEKLVATIRQLSDSPNRGTYPKELSILGIREFREIFFKPYRIIYQVVGKAVYVMLVADGRRDMRALLLQRLLGTWH